MTDALAVLASCPEGATLDALVRNAGCKPEALAALVRQGLARVRTAPLANPPGFVVTRYWITGAGLAAIRPPSRRTPGRL